MKHSEKISILVALVLFGGLGFYGFSVSNAKRPTSADVQAIDTSQSTEAVPVVATSAGESAPVVFNWAKPVSQDENDPKWIYGLFTPPKIWLNDGEFRVVPPVPVDEVAVVPFGLVLKNMGTIYYPIIIQGYSGQAKSPLFNVSLCDKNGNPVKDSEMIKRIGGVIPDLNTVIVSFDNKPIMQPDGSLKRNETVLVRELSGKEVLLTVGVPYDTGIYEISLTPESSSGEINIVLDKNGDAYTINTIQGNATKLDDTSFIVGEQKYRLTHVDVASKKITLEKIDAKGKKAEEKILSLDNASVTAPADAAPSSTTEDTDASSGDSFSF